MKNKIYYLLFVTLVSVYSVYSQNTPVNPTVNNPLQGSKPQQPSGKENNIKNPAPAQDKNNDATKNDEKKDVRPADAIKLSPGIAGLFYSLYVQELPQETFITVDGSKIINRRSRSVIKDGVVKAEAFHIVTEQVLRVFNKPCVEQCFKTKLEDGTAVIQVPKGTPVQIDAIDPVKAVTVIGIAIAVVAGIFAYKKGYVKFPRTKTDNKTLRGDTNKINYDNKEDSN